MKLIDLSHNLFDSHPVYPGDRPFSLKKEKNWEQDGYSLYFLSSNLHAGTHLDAPDHLSENPKKINQIPLEQCCGKGILLDVRGQAVIKPNAALAEKILPHSMVLLWTGWDQYYGTETYFSEHPIIDSRFSELLVEKQVKLLGMDMPSPDTAPYQQHEHLLKHQILLLENLTNLKHLEGLTDFFITAFPIKLAAEASFVRAVAFLS